MGKEFYCEGVQVTLVCGHVLGMQGAGVQACTRHVINNEQDYDRTFDIDDRTQHEIYAHLSRVLSLARALIVCVFSFLCCVFD